MSIILCGSAFAKIEVVRVGQNQPQVIDSGAMLPHETKLEFGERCQLMPAAHIQAILIEAFLTFLKIEDLFILPITYLRERTNKPECGPVRASHGCSMYPSLLHNHRLWIEADLVLQLLR